MSKLSNIFVSVLGLSEEEIVSSLSPQTVSAWDSLNAIILLSEIEKAFDLKFDYDEAMSIKNFGDVMKLIEKHGGDSSS